MQLTLTVITGPTGVGKTDVAIRLARHIGSPVISADSRQIYKEMPIGTAMPSPEQLAAVKHYFIATHSVTDYYSASLYEEEAIALINKLHRSQPDLLLCGGSMLYIDAVCKGIDEMPTVTADIRNALWQQFETEGLTNILLELKNSDPKHYEEVDRQNHRRVIHAVEICRMTGKPYSSFRTQQPKQRPFRIIRIGLNRPRDELYARINARVDAMINAGLVEEARKLYPLRHLNALNTVGYKELFAYFDGSCSLDEAIDKIKRNTRVYARKQLTWYRNDLSIRWFHPDDELSLQKFISTIRQ
ncbi:MAG: tRNA (adenosine(37)-N6)-dimethylallyltransferase MiaA [Tannerella sp.]|jgi:tRNA dimethylallyltransferase|nr:tRNA (adenosine(37)-N6)-dimethylallyltransferase MiaA [Tannerella sp.]